MWYVRDVLYAVLYVRVSCFVVFSRFLLHIPNSMDALEAVRPSLFADITISAIYFRRRMCYSYLMCWKNLHHT